MEPTSAPPTLRLSGALSRALSGEVLRSIESRDLARFLFSCRWFGGKGREAVAVRIAEVIPLEWGDGDQAAVVRLVVDGGVGQAASYQLPLVVREAEMSGPHAPPTHAVLALVDADGVRGVVFDALHDPRFRAQLGAALGRGASFAGDGARWQLEPVGEGAGEIGALPSRVVAGEQSNSSVIYGDHAIFKLFRKLESGVNPDVEITRFLTTRTAFRHTPELLGELRYHPAPPPGTAGGAADAADIAKDADTADIAAAAAGIAADDIAGQPCVGGMLSRFVSDATDGWAYALADINRYLSSRSDGGAPPGSFVADAARLGAITRELHEALASDHTDPAFAPVPITSADVDRWADNARAMVGTALDLLGARLPALHAKVAPMARAIAGRRAAALALFDEVARAARVEESLATHPIRIRTHGDYHLGQLLHASDDRWFVIDFEGEPARALAERRELGSPARDVAGMLRSFAYAAATGAAHAGGLGVSPATEIHAAHWERDSRAAFLSEYGAEPDDPLIALFEMEKLFYELEYELNNRPDWVWVPLRGIARLF